MYDLIETGHGTPRTTSYPTLHEATDGLTDRAAAFMRTPGATILTQRPRQFAATGRAGERITLHLRKRAPRHASKAGGHYVAHPRRLPHSRRALCQLSGRSTARSVPGRELTLPEVKRITR